MKNLKKIREFLENLESKDLNYFFAFELTSSELSISIDNSEWTKLKNQLNTIAETELDFKFSNYNDIKSAKVVFEA